MCGSFSFALFPPFPLSLFLSFLLTLPFPLLFPLSSLYFPLPHSLSPSPSLPPSHFLCFFCVFFHCTFPRRDLFFLQFRCVHQVEMFQFRWKWKKRQEKKWNLSNYLEKLGKSLSSLWLCCLFFPIHLYSSHFISDALIVDIEHKWLPGIEIQFQ